MTIFLYVIAGSFLTGCIALALGLYLTILCELIEEVAERVGPPLERLFKRWWRR